MRFICALQHERHGSGRLQLAANDLTGACLSPASISRELADCCLTSLNRELKIADVSDMVCVCENLPLTNARRMRDKAFKSGAVSRFHLSGRRCGVVMWVAAL